MKFTEWLNEHKEGDNLCPPPMSINEFESFLIDYLLPENYCIVMSMSEDQCRTQLLHDILQGHSKKYRKEYIKWLEKIGYR